MGNSSMKYATLINLLSKKGINYGMQEINRVGHGMIWFSLVFYRIKLNRIDLLINIYQIKSSSI